MNDISENTARVLIMVLQESNALMYLNGKLSTGVISVEAYNAGLDYVSRTNGNILLRDVSKVIEKADPQKRKM